MVLEGQHNTKDFAPLCGRSLDLLYRVTDYTGSFGPSSDGWL